MGFWDTIGSVVTAPYEIVKGAVTAPINSIGSLGGKAASGVQSATTNNYQASMPTGAAESEADRQKRFLDEINNARNPQAGSNSSELNSMLMSRAQGTAPSVVGQQMNQAQDQAQQQAMAQAASSRGGVNPALLQRNLMQNQAAGQQQLVQQTGIAKLQEQQQAQQLALENQKRMDQISQYYEALGLDSAKAQLMAQLEVQKINAGVADQNTKNSTQLLGGVTSGIASGAAAAAAASDERVKENVKPGSKEVYSFLDALSSHKYKYKEPEKHGEGDQISVMAQELERSPMGKAFVDTDEEGTKIVNYGKGFGAILAAQSELHDRMKKLEKRG